MARETVTVAHHNFHFLLTEKSKVVVSTRIQFFYKTTVTIAPLFKASLGP
ncbi:hypothetical protein SOVF_020030 [Spinacia oleracea]|nr:hypothetical protein SOVF_020030 [Spinacia oleracea]